MIGNGGAVTQARRKASKKIWRALLLLAIGISLFMLFRGVDWRATDNCLLGLRFAAPLVLMPYFLEIALDVWAWRFTFERTWPVAWTRLFEIRLVT